MEYLYYYFATMILLIVGYFIGMLDERRNGRAAAQKQLDREIEHFNEEVRLWQAVEDALPPDKLVTQKRNKGHKHLRLIK